MQLLASWRSSLAILLPNNFKNYVLISLRSIGRTYCAWFAHWWFLIGLYVATELYIWCCYMPMSGFFGSYYVDIALSVVRFLAIASVHMTLYLSVRPSTGLKNYTYYFGFARHFIFAAIWFFLLTQIDAYIFHTFHGSILYLYFAIIPLISMFFVLFLLDSDASLLSVLKSCIRSIKMFVYNLPFCLFLSFFVGLLLVGIAPAVHFVIQSVGGLFTYDLDLLAYLSGLLDDLLIVPISLCFTTTLYVKKVHEQYGVYFG